MCAAENVNEVKTRLISLKSPSVCICVYVCVSVCKQMSTDFAVGCRLEVIVMCRKGKLVIRSLFRWYQSMTSLKAKNKQIFSCLYLTSLYEVPSHVKLFLDNSAVKILLISIFSKMFFFGYQLISHWIRCKKNKKKKTLLNRTRTRPVILCISLVAGCFFEHLRHSGIPHFKIITWELV